MAMERSIRKALLTLLLFSATPGIPAAVAANAPQNLPSNTSKSLKGQIKEHQDNILKIKNEINDIEGQLANANKRFISIEKEKGRLDGEIYKTNLDLQKMKENLTLEIERARKVLNSLIVNSLSKEEDSKGILRKKILTQVAQIKLTELKKEKVSVEKMEQQIELYRKKLDESYEIAGALSDTLSQMEAHKKLLANDYVSQIQIKTKLESEFKIAASKAKQAKNVAKSNVVRPANTVEMSFIAPLENYISHEYDHEGVTYKFQGDKKVIGTQAGRVVFSGPLANYGNAVMIDHGADTRSIILGNFKPAVKKGQQITMGQVIGSASSYSKGSGSIYFEVRHKKQVQNTFKLIEKERYSRNNTSVKQIRFEGT